MTALLAPLDAPVIATPGNHDLRENVAAAFGGATSAELDGWRIVLVDTVIPGEIHGAVDIAAVEAVLGPDEGVPTVVVLHHPRSRGARCGGSCSTGTWTSCAS